MRRERLYNATGKAFHGTWNMSVLNKRAALFVGLMLTALSSGADMNAFGPGAVIEDYGPVAPVPWAAKIPQGTVFKIAYDTRVRGEEGKPNRTLETAARFLNMHQAAGVRVENMQLAVVVHGPAHRDLLHAKSYGGVNPSEKLIEQLIANGGRIHLCGSRGNGGGPSVHP